MMGIRRVLAVVSLALVSPFPFAASVESVSSQQPPPAAPAPSPDRARILDLIKQAEALIANNAGADAAVLLQPLFNERFDADRALEGDLEFTVGRAFDRQSKYPDALAHYQRSVDAYRAVKDRRNEARAIRQIAQLHKNTGGYEEAVKLGEQALAIYTELGDSRNVAISWIVLGATHDSVGDHRRALASFEKALPAFAGEKSHDVVNLMNEIGITHKNLGNYGEAKRVYTSGLELAREIDDKSGAAFLSLNLGVLHGTIGENEIAVQYHQQALRLAREVGDRRGETIVLMNLADSYWDLGDKTRALDALEADLLLAREMKVRNTEGLIDKDLGDIHASSGNLPLARAKYDDALKLQREIGERKSIASTLVALADLDLREGRTGEAITLASEGAALARESARPELEWTALRSLAAAAAASGQTARAIEELRASARIINDLRANVVSDMSKVAFVDRRQEVFADLASLLISTGRADEALVAAEAGRARAFADLLRQRQILGKPADRPALAGVRKAEEDYQKALATRPTPNDAPESAARLRGGELLADAVSAIDADHHELASLITAQSPTMDDVRQATARLHATLVEYLVGERQLLAWVVGPDGVVHSATVAVTRERLDALATEVRAAVDASLGVVASGGEKSASPSSQRRSSDTTSRSPGGGNTSAAPLFQHPSGDATRSSRGTARAAADKPTERKLHAALAELHRWLIAPIDAWLPAAPEQPVVIVPHGPLAVVPFAALEDDARRPFVERHVLSFAPAAAVFAYTGDKHGRAATTRRALVVADPVPPADSQIARLPYAREEGRLVARRLSGKNGGAVTLLVGQDASEAAIKRGAAGYSILHFATHGLVASDRPLASSLLFGEGGGEDGYLRVDEIFNLDLAADLVVLSGCATGLGKLTGDGIVGLTRAFLYAGTPTVVVSQWNVSDRATTVLMDRFYAELSRGGTKAQALRAAAMAARKQFPHPAFWAAFEVVGEP